MLKSSILPSLINGGLWWTPVDSTEIYLYMYNIVKMQGVQWTPVDSTAILVGVPPESSGVQWSPPESTGVQ